MSLLSLCLCVSVVNLFVTRYSVLSTPVRALYYWVKVLTDTFCTHLATRTYTKSLLTYVLINTPLLHSDHPSVAIR